MTTGDRALHLLHTLDPDHYLLHEGPTPSADGWRAAASLAEPEIWPDIARAYAADVGCTSVVVGGSCALQGYAGRVAALTVGRWVVTGQGLPTAETDLRVRLRRGRTVSLQVGVSSAGGPDTPARIADDLHTHLMGIVAASRTVSRLRERVAWGNVAAAVAGAWRRVHDAAPPAYRPALRRHARDCLSADVWPWQQAPLRWDVLPHTPFGTSLVFHRHTCCLMRLSPEKAECASCSDLDADTVVRRWATAPTTLRPPPAVPMGAHVDL